MKRCLECETRHASDSWVCPACGFEPPDEAGIPVFAPSLATAISGYDSTLFDMHGSELADRSFWAVGRAEMIVWALRTYAPDASKFLEVGCGTGGVLAHLERAFPAMHLIGSEALMPGLHAAHRRLSRTALMQCDATRLPFVDEFDAIGAFDVIEHIKDDRSMIRGMAAALAPGGVVLITVPQHPFLYGPADVAARHERRYTAAGLRAALRASGLTVECLTSFVSLLFPAMAAVRLAAKYRAGAYDSAEEFKIGSLNGVFLRVMAAERWSIRRGLRWPFGGSLLAVARK